MTPTHIKISVSPLMGIELGGHMVVRAWVVEYKDQARASDPSLVHYYSRGILVSTPLLVQAKYWFMLS